MHELSLVTELVEAAERAAAGRPVRSVLVRCAETLDAEELRFAFALVATGALAGSSLEVEQTPVRITCNCGYDGAPAGGGSEHVACCPACAAPHALEASLELVSLTLAGG